MSQQQQDVNQGGDKVRITSKQGNQQELGANKQNDNVQQDKQDNQQQNNQMRNQILEVEHMNEQVVQASKQKQQPNNQIDQYQSDYEREEQIVKNQNQNEYKQQQQQLNKQQSPQVQQPQQVFKQQQQQTQQQQQQQTQLQQQQQTQLQQQQQPLQQQQQQPQLQKQGQKQLQKSPITASSKQIPVDNPINTRQLQQQQKQYIPDESPTSQPTPPLPKHNPLPITTQYNKLFQQLRKYLIVAYYSYVIDYYSSTNNIFNKNQIFKKPHLDITLFLKFYKDFHLKDIYKVNQIIKTFKSQAINRLRIDANLLIKVIITVVENKCEDNSAQPTLVNDQSQRLERLIKLMKMFDKEKIRIHLKSKQLWQEIFLLYSQRDDTNKTVEKPHQNKVQVVGQFLQRNFNRQVPKWLQKKDKQPIINPEPKAIKKSSNNKSNSNIKKLLTEQSPSPINDDDKINRKRDQKTISNNIERLRTKSEKSIINLKKMISKDFSLEKDTKQLITKKSATNDKSNNRPKIHKTPSSVTKQIEDFLILENSRLLKSQDTILMKDLNLKDDQPYLRQYFQNEFNGNKSNLLLSQKKKDKHNKMSIQNVNKNINNNMIDYNKNRQIIEQSSVNRLPKIPPPYIQQPSPNIHRRKQALSLKQQPRKYVNVQSQPSHRQQKGSKRIGQKEQPRSQSMKKLSEELGKKRLNEKDVIEKKVYEYLMRNKEHLLSVNAGANKNGKLSLDRGSYQKQLLPARLQKSISTQIKKTLLANEINPSSSTNNQRKQVYHMWKNFI